MAGHFYLASLSNRNNYNNIPNNALVLTKCKTLKHIVCSAAEATCISLFHNCNTALAIQSVLNKMGYQQQPTWIKADNKATNYIVHISMHIKWSKY
eukprot:12328822-Ditylum_brightwellii.AAC.1